MLKIIISMSEIKLDHSDTKNVDHLFGSFTQRKERFLEIDRIFNSRKFYVWQSTQTVDELLVIHQGHRQT